jgi:hypothetical protein
MKLKTPVSSLFFVVGMAAALPTPEGDVWGDALVAGLAGILGGALGASSIPPKPVEYEYRIVDCDDLIKEAIDTAFNSVDPHPDKFLDNLTINLPMFVKCRKDFRLKPFPGPAQVMAEQIHDCRKVIESHVKTAFVDLGPNGELKTSYVVVQFPERYKCPKLKMPDPWPNPKSQFKEPAHAIKPNKEWVEPEGSWLKESPCSEGRPKLDMWGKWDICEAKVFEQY